MEVLFITTLILLAMACFGWWGSAATADSRKELIEVIREKAGDEVVNDSINELLDVYKELLKKL
jgi:hypothetical protein